MRTNHRTRKLGSKAQWHGGGGPDIVSLLRREHGSIRSAVQRAAGGTAEESRAAHAELAELTVRHEVAEELVVYPAVLRLRGGAAVADRNLQDQDEIERLLIAADRAPVDSREFELGSVQLGLKILSHLENEEIQVLPMLSTMIGARRRAELGHRYLEVQKLAPMGRVVPGARLPTGPTVVDRTAAVAVWMRDSAVFSGLAS